MKHIGFESETSLPSWLGEKHSSVLGAKKTSRIVRALDRTLAMGSTLSVNEAAHVMNVGGAHIVDVGIHTVRA